MSLRVKVTPSPPAPQGGKPLAEGRCEAAAGGPNTAEEGATGFGFRGFAFRGLAIRFRGLGFGDPI